MVDCHVFDVWSGSYDEEVQLADENDEYPFAGYRKIIELIYIEATKHRPVSVLDVGIGTGVLSTALYEKGNRITGIDFSSEMLAIAKTKMPKATFYQCDFANGLPSELVGAKYDFIISTYALHHLPDTLKVTFIKSLLSYLNQNGVIFVGDIGFSTRDEFNKCKVQNDDDWDDDEYYFIFSELLDSLSGACAITYNQISHCAGLMEIRLPESLHTV